MKQTISASVEIWPVAGAFTISRGSKTEVAVVVVEVSGEGVTGRGEATPIYYHGETAVTCAETIMAWQGKLSKEALADRMPRGAARNALDAAIWDWEAKRTGIPCWQQAGRPLPTPVVTAMTVSVAAPEGMEAQARAYTSRGAQLIKLKLSGEGDVERVAAVRRGAPDVRLIVDANEAWTGLNVAAMATELVPYGVELIEQPVKAGEDHLLDGVVSPIPLGADESLQDRADLARCLGRYDVINIKLDKAGGLTEGLALAAEARAAGMRLMVGCMLSTSLGIAPALLLADQAEWVDLDGPLLLARDREGGVQWKAGLLVPPAPDFWG